MALERKVRDVEMVAHRLMQDNERRNREHQYRSQVLHNTPQVCRNCKLFFKQMKSCRDKSILKKIILFNF